MASSSGGNNDWANTLHQAIIMNPDSPRQLELLNSLTRHIQSQPNAITSIWINVIGIISDERPLPLANWAAETMRQALCKPATTSTDLSSQTKTTLALQALGSISRLLTSSNVPLQKIGLQLFASSYPLLFKHSCTNPNQQTWSSIVNAKTAALTAWRAGSMGAKLAAIKVLQRIIQTQTRGSADPRLQRTAEPNLALVPPSHPFLKTSALEDEANRLLEECITMLFTSRTPDLISALTLTLAALVKVRPAFAQLIVTAFTNWTPSALTGQATPLQIRSVEKSVRASLSHLLKNSHASAFQAQIAEFLSRQSARMEAAAAEARQQRDQEQSRKRQLLVEQISAAAVTTNGDDGHAAKRRRIDTSVVDATVFGTGSIRPEFPTGFSVESLPLQAVVAAVVVGLQSVTEMALNEAVASVRVRLNRPRLVDSGITVQPQPPIQPLSSVLQPLNGQDEDPYLKAEPVDPLNLDLGAEELEMKPEVEPAPEDEPESEPEEDQAAIDFTFDLAAEGTSASLVDLSPSAKTAMIEAALRRIFLAGADGASSSVWVPLAVRLITRGLGPSTGDEIEPAASGDDVAEDAKAKSLARQDKLRQVIYEFVTADLGERMEFAKLWLNEEWYASMKTSSDDRPYDRWLRKLLEFISDHSTNRDKTFSQFIVDLPQVPTDEFGRLCDMCLKTTQVQLGFTALRDLSMYRPPARGAALDVLFGLCTHAGKLTRTAAIQTVKRWVPDTQPLSQLVIDFALSLYARLEQLPEPEIEAKKEDEEGTSNGAGVGDGEGAEGDEMDMDETPPPEPVKIPFAVVKDGRVVDRLDPPKILHDVLQHVELLLALCVKQPDLLDPVFAGFGRLQPVAQEHLQTLIVPLIRTLGKDHDKVLDILQKFPDGSEELVLRMLNILFDKQRLPKDFIEAIKAAARRKDLPAKFYPMIIADCHKPEVLQYLPKIVSLLDGTPEQKTMIRSVFLAATAPPSVLAGKNAPNKTKADEITAVELMTLLHKSEKEAGVKQTIEAIGVCFSMPDAFRPEVLVSFMQFIVDEPIVPVLFMRTVLQAVSTYKQLYTYVATTLLSRLIAKKVWTIGPLWEGFIRCVKLTAPNSFPAVLQLPIDPLEAFVNKQPALREPLLEFVRQKFTNNVKGPSDELLRALGAQVVTTPVPVEGNSIELEEAASSVDHAAEAQTGAGGQVDVPPTTSLEQQQQQ